MIAEFVFAIGHVLPFLVESDDGVRGGGALELVEDFHTRYANLPLILLSASPPAPEALAGARGRVRFLGKPLELQELRQAVAAHARQRRRVDARRQLGDLGRLEAAAAPSIRIAREPRHRVTRQLVRPRPERALAAKAGEAAPQVFAELREHLARVREQLPCSVGLGRRLGVVGAGEQRLRLGQPCLGLRPCAPGGGLADGAPGRACGRFRT